MANLLALIKRAAVEAVEAGAPCGVFFGRVTATAPLTVRLDSRFVLESGHLLRADRAAHLREGDAVLLLRAQGGKRYVILDTMREGTL